MIATQTPKIAGLFKELIMSFTLHLRVCSARHNQALHRIAAPGAAPGDVCVICVKDNPHSALYPYF